MVRPDCDNASLDMRTQMLRSWNRTPAEANNLVGLGYFLLLDSDH
jgi:hypothetical protein